MNNRGALTIDYMFSFFLVAGFSLIIITFSATFSMVEILQYMTFSSARNYFAGHISEEAQKNLAAQKFADLRTSKAVGPLLSGGWFNVPDDGVLIDYDLPQKYPALQDYGQGPVNRNLFHGVVIFFTSKILEFQTPFFGSTKKADGSTANGFNAYIGSYVGREPSFEECDRFNAERWNAIRRLGDNNTGEPYSKAGNGSGYIVMNDNGC